MRVRIPSGICQEIPSANKRRRLGIPLAFRGMFDDREDTPPPPYDIGYALIVHGAIGQLFLFRRCRGRGGFDSLDRTMPDHLRPPPDPHALRSENELLAAIVATQQEVATAGLEPDAVVGLITRRSQELTGATGAAVGLLEGDEMVYRAASGSAEASVGLRVKAAAGLPGLCVRNAEVLLCDDAEVDDRVDRGTCRNVGARSMAVVPLLQNGAPAGVLKVLSDRAGAFGAREVQTLRLMAGLTAAALGNAGTAAAQAHLAAIIDSSDDAILSTSLEGVILSWNAAAGRLFGHAAAEAIGGPISLVVPPDRLDEEQDILERVRAGGRVKCLETVWLARGGLRLHVCLTVSPVRGGDGCVVGTSKIVRDSTEQKRTRQELQAMTQQLWQAAKLATVGELAASLAHELNNPLGTVQLRLESVLGKTPPDDPRRRELEVIEQEVDRIASLISGLLQFSRRDDERTSIVDVRAELVNVVELIHDHLRKRQIVVAQDFSPDSPLIVADPQKLRQLFLNLISNAGDAMAQGGTLTLRVSPATLDSGRPAVRVEFADTGVGIPTEHVGSIMEPFFTTKEAGKGTGLGLAICKRVVREHRGTIDVASEVGRGTTFRIVLPAGK